MLYSILEAMTREGKAALEDDDPTTNPNSDGIIKITNAIKKLETHTGVGDVIETLMRFIKFIASEDLDLSKKITTWADIFIHDALKKAPE